MFDCVKIWRSVFRPRNYRLRIGNFVLVIMIFIAIVIGEMKCFYLIVVWACLSKYLGFAKFFSSFILG